MAQIAVMPGSGKGAVCLRVNLRARYGLEAGKRVGQEIKKEKRMRALRPKAALKGAPRLTGATREGA